MAIPAEAGENRDAEPTGDRGLDEIREDIRRRGSNINAQTLLATDYLNHFNEIIMMIELAADMSDMFELTAGWAPLGYEDHFVRSKFSDRQLAVEAYAHSPQEVRSIFDDTVVSLDDLLLSGLDQAGAALAAGDQDVYALTCRGLVQAARNHIDRLSAIIHGRHDEFATEIELESETLEDTQNTIDTLFET
jgi:hypothetical protein